MNKILSPSNILTICALFLFSGCMVSYVNHSMNSQRGTVRIDGAEMYAQMNRVSGQSIRESKGPWLLTITLEFEGYVRDVALIDAKIVTKTGQVIQIDLREPVVEAVDGSWRAAVTAPEVGYEPPDGEVFDVEVQLLIRRKGSEQEVREVFPFRARIFKGRERLNPFLDIT